VLFLQFINGELMTVQELRNLAVKEARKLIEEDIMKLPEEHREQARKEISSSEFHPYSLKIIAKSRKAKMQIQGIRLRPDKYHTEKEEVEECQK
jgi:hypothetical protein